MNAFEFPDNCDWDTMLITELDAMCQQQPHVDTDPNPAMITPPSPIFTLHWLNDLTDFSIAQQSPVLPYIVTSGSTSTPVLSSELGVVSPCWSPITMSPAETTFSSAYESYSPSMTMTPMSCIINDTIPFQEPTYHHIQQHQQQHQHQHPTLTHKHRTGRPPAPNKPDFYQCPSCDLRFERKHDCKRHELARHGGGKAHVCVYCAKTFARKDSLIKHLRCEERRRGAESRGGDDA